MATARPNISTRDRFRNLFGKRVETDVRSPSVVVTPSTPVDPKDVWKEEILYIAKGVNIHEETLPLSKLQAIADLYLVKDESLTDEQWSVQLKTLVSRSGAKHFALLSCAHMLRRNDVRLLLRTLFDSNASNTDIAQYLAIIPVLKVLNEAAIDDVEVSWSRSLKDFILMTSNNPVRRIFQFNQILLTTPPDPLLIPLSMASIETIVNQLAKEINSSRQNHMWLNWVEGPSDYLDPSNLEISPTITALVEDSETWAQWQPNQTRLEEWSVLFAEDRKRLIDLLKLEGPDFLSGNYTTLKHSLFSELDASGMRIYGSHIGSLITGHEDYDEIRIEEILEHLLTAIDNAVSMKPKALLAFKQIYESRPIDVETIEGVAAAAETKDANLFCIFVSIVLAQSDGVQLTGVMQGVPLLSRISDSTLRERMTPTLVQIIESNLVSLQNRLIQCIKSRRHPNEIVNRISDLIVSLSGADWLTPHLSPETTRSIEQIPSRTNIDALFKLQERYCRPGINSESPLLKLLNTYLSVRFGGRAGSSSDDGVVDALIDIWKAPVNRERRELSYTVAMAVSMPMSIRAECIQAMEDMSEKLMIDLKDIISVASEENSRRLTKLLISRNILFDSPLACWHKVLHWMIEDQGADLGSSITSVEEWFAWLKDLAKIATMWQGHLQCDHTLLDPTMVAWTYDISTKHLLAALKRLEKHMKGSAGLQWILRSSRHRSTVILSLELLDPSVSHPLDPVVESLLQTLDPNGDNLPRFCKTLALLKLMSDEGTRLCLRMCQIGNGPDKTAAEYFINSWQQRNNLNLPDRLAIRAYARALGLGLDLDSRTINSRLDAAAALLVSDFKGIISEVELVDKLRRLLHSHDAEKTSALVSRLGITFATSPRGSTNIPPSLINVVECIGEGEYEFLYPLTHLKPLQRVSLAVNKAQALLVQVMLNPETGESAFCIHLHPSNISSGSNPKQLQTHSYWRVPRHSSAENAPDKPICFGKHERITYQLSRTLHRYLATNGRNCRVEELYNFMSARILNLSSCCIVCGNFSSTLWRSTTCQVNCSLLWRRASLHIRLVDIQVDHQVVDLLMTMVYSAAVSAVGTLLSGCPIEAASVAQTINTIPALSTLQNSQDIALAVRSLGPSVEKILSWATHSYRGFLTSATGNFKIPNMPGVTQFLFANQNPEHHSAFSQFAAPGRVVFHGTTLDRLHAIVCNGLKILSGTALQRNGAYSGPGIYVAEEPSMSMGYAHLYNNRLWGGSSFTSIRVLLGCELVGPQSLQAKSMHVVTNEHAIAVRYIFIFSNGTPVPERRHIVDAIDSAYAALRSGVA